MHSKLAAVLKVVEVENRTKPNSQSGGPSKWETPKTPISCQKKTEAPEDLCWSSNSRFVSVTSFSSSNTDFPARSSRCTDMELSHRITTTMPSPSPDNTTAIIELGFPRGLPAVISILLCLLSADVFPDAPQHCWNQLDNSGPGAGQHSQSQMWARESPASITVSCASR